MLACYDIARYFITLVDEESGEKLTHLKLQKLVYYAQGFHLALYDTPLFPEPIEAWAHGPVVPELYHLYKKYEAQALPLPEEGDFSIYPSDVKELLNEVHTVYGQFSAWKLRDLTHEEPPWKNAYGTGDSTISQEAMRTFFKTLLIDDPKVSNTP